MAFGTYSCRPMSDELLSYGQNDDQVFAAAGRSYAEEFKTLWMAMNENYCIWDYEEQCGLDWDAVYDMYLPQFEALDKRQKDVTDEEFVALYKQIMDSLHDGHMYVTLQNLSTGHFLTVNPNSDRNMRERPEVFTAEGENVTSLDYYQSTTDTRYKIQDLDGTGSGLIVVEVMDSTAHRILRAADAYIAAVDAAGGPDEFNDSIYSGANKIKAFAQNLLDVITVNPMAAIENSLSSMVADYNKACTIYTLVAQQIGVKMPTIDTQIGDDDLKSLRFALFEGNVVYLRIGAFGLSRHLEPAYKTTDTTTMYYAYQQAVNRVWQHWFDTIQSLHASGRLGGVIFDLRNNGGGLVNDYQYALGALLPSGGWHSHTLRVKNGTGRLDFAPLVPFSCPTYSGTHAIISEEPIVVLANSHSGSLAENTTWGVMNQPNGYFIGTRTYGALSALNPVPEAYSETYSGAFGVKNVTPIYGFLPKYVCLYGEDLHVVEGHGFDPDENLPLDVDLWKSTGRDNQLERALDYVKNH